MLNPYWIYNLFSPFLLWSKHLLISWLQLPSEVILEPKKIKSVIISIVSLFAMKWCDRMPWSSFMTNVDSLLKSRDITLPTKVRIVKAMVFPVVMYGCETWTIKKAECERIDTFELWCWRKLLRVHWTARRSNQSILKEISPGFHWKDWCWSWNSNTLANSCETLTHWERSWCWERLGAGEEGDDRGWDG